MPHTTQSPAIRQRDLLSKLGIDLWVARDSQVVPVEVFEAQSQHTDVAAHTLATNNTGDSNNDEMATPVAPVVPDHQTETEIKNQTATKAVSETAIDTPDIEQSGASTINNETEQPATHSHAVEPTESDATPIIAPDQTSDPDAIITAAETTTVDESAHEAVAFDLFALRYKNSLVLCDSNTIVTEKDATLWQNIQSGLNAQLESLSFPLSEKLSSEKSAAQASIMGWLYRLSSELPENQQRQVIILGDTPTYLPKSVQVINQASLADMITEPMRKKALWQAINV